MNKAVITPAEADSFLSIYTSWSNLSQEQKLNAIAKASVYAQTTWICANVDWDAVTDANIKEAVAYYAYAASAGALYGDVTVRDEPHGKLRSDEYKVGVLTTKKAWYRGGATQPQGKDKSLAYPDTLMKTVCIAKTFDTEIIRD